MDWLSWLSRSNLEPSLIYKYGNIFVHNELEKEDIPYFNHEFLLSMQITIAKHRLEILKLARKESEGKGTPQDHSLSRIVLKFNIAKRHIAKRISKMISRGNATIKAMPETSHQDMWRGDLKRNMSEKEHKDNRMIVQKHMRPTLSGPLDVRMVHEKTVHRGLKLSGPLDGRVNERMVYDADISPRVSGKVGRVFQDKGMFVSKSPIRKSGPLDGKLVSSKSCSQQNKEIIDGTDGDMYDDEEVDPSLWTVMFQDMKPT